MKISKKLPVLVFSSLMMSSFSASADQLVCSNGTPRSVVLPKSGIEVRFCNDVRVETSRGVDGRSYERTYLFINKPTKDITFQVGKAIVTFNQSQALSAGDRFQFFPIRLGATSLAISDLKLHVVKEGGYGSLSGGFLTELSDGRCYDRGSFYGYFSHSRPSKSYLMFNSDSCPEIVRTEFTISVPELAPGDVFIPRPGAGAAGEPSSSGQVFGTGLGG